MKFTKTGIISSFNEWQALLGKEHVRQDTETITQYEGSTTGVTVKILGVIFPKTTEEIKKIVQIASAYHIPLYPVSTGKNWGYTDASPLTDSCVVLDLSRMNAIIAFDKELGTITIEPGVTQKQLYEFLQENGGRYLTPVTGAGPDCSILGNALERGYGITPIADHFQAVTSLRAVLADGSTYYSGLDSMGGTAIDRLFKWTVGPYYDGIFSQSNLGIVTEITITLAHTPEHAVAYFFWVPERKFERAVLAIRTILEQTGALGSSINLMNNYRILSMGIPYPRKEIGNDGYITPALASKLARRQMYTDWTGIGCVYGTRRVVKAAKRDIASALRSNTGMTIFLSQRQLRFLQKISKIFFFIPKLGDLVSKLQGTFDVFLGNPTRIAIPLAHWKVSGTKNENDIIPHKDPSGLLWYSPLIPMRPTEVHAYTEMVKRICIEHKIDPLITLTSLSEKCFDSTVPILFRRDDEEEQTRAHACYHALLTEGIKHGWYPYRLGTTSMRELIDSNEIYVSFMSKIKHAIDPKGIIAPGRYASLEK